MNSTTVRFFPEITPIVKALIIINSIIFGFQYFDAFFLDRFFFQTFSLNPNLIRKLYLWQFLSYAFLHGSFMHLLLNMLSLWMFGSDLENYFGKEMFLKFYLFSCLFGGITTWLFHLFGFPQGIVVGASGGIYGIFVAYAMIWPNREIYFMGLFPIKVKYMVLIIMLAVALSPSDDIAHVTHMGGVIGGFLFIYFIFGFYHQTPITAFKKFFSRIIQKYKMKKWQNEMKKEINTKEEVDRILDKISKNGMSSLTKNEREYLKKASKDYPEN